MRSIPIPALAVILALGACATPPSGLSVQDSTALRGMLEQVQQDLVKRDFAAWSATFADSGWFMPPASPAIVGREAIASWMAGTPDMSSATFTNVQLAGSGNVAYGTSDASIQFVGLPVSEGKQLVVWERQGDGSWKVARWALNASIQRGTVTVTP
jgi:ketosteroid isomerase-like protein